MGTKSVPKNTTKRQRRTPRTCGIYIRHAIRGLYQLRWWISVHAPGGGSINCGLYDEWTASQLRSAIAAGTNGQECSALGIWRAATIALDRFRARGFKVPNLMPKYVQQTKDGRYFAKVRLKGKPIVLKRTYATPELAHLAMLKKLDRLKDCKRK